MEIYWISGGKKCGPAIVPDLLPLLESGEITPETKGWHKGCPDWTPLRDLPALAFYFKEDGREEFPPVGTDDAIPSSVRGASLPDAGSGETVPTAPIQVIAAPPPVLRFLARVLDSVLYMTLVFGLLRLLGAPFHPLYGTPLLWLPMYFLEGFLLSRYGATPGKMLLGISVTRLDGSRLSGSQGIYRGIQVFLFGVGFMYSILPLFMMAISWYQVRMRGVATWDARLGLVPRMASHVGSERLLAALLLVFACMVAAGMLVQAWVPDMLAWMNEAFAGTGTEIPSWLKNMLKN